MSKTSSIWHPFTQHALFPDAVMVDHADGAAYYTKDGRRLIDAISSWWVNIHGHNHPHIVKSVQAAAERLDQVIFAGYTHEWAEKLADHLVAVTPAPLTKVFYSDSGSTSVEIALKMAVGYWAHQGQKRTGIIALEHGYHGDTFGAMAVGARGVFNAPYNDMLFQVHRLPFPERGQEQRTLDCLLRVIHENPDQIAALILEPLVLGAGGMLMYTPDVLRQLHEVCQQHQIIFIADEVMTGWGRTGTKFACEQAGIAPDILCLSKGLTGGFLPLAVTLATDEIYSAFYSHDRAKTFFHSSSFTGNAMACAAALASMELWAMVPVQKNIDRVASLQKQAVERLAQRPDVVRPRQTGTIIAFDVMSSEQGGYVSQLMPLMTRFFMRHNVVLRPIGQTIYVLPPYCISSEDLDVVTSTIECALDVLRDGKLE